MIDLKVFEGKISLYFHDEAEYEEDRRVIFLGLLKSNLLILFLLFFQYIVDKYRESLFINSRIKQGIL